MRGGGGGIEGQKEPGLLMILTRDSLHQPQAASLQTCLLSGGKTNFYLN